MKLEPLSGKRQALDQFHKIKSDSDKGYIVGYLKAMEATESAVKGLIKYHEDIIEDLVKELSQWQATTIYKHIDNDCYPYPWIFILKRIQEEYESIMALEHWLEDVI